MTTRITNNFKLALAGLLLLLSLVVAQVAGITTAPVDVSQEPGISIVCDPYIQVCPSGGGG